MYFDNPFSVFVNLMSNITKPNFTKTIIYDETRGHRLLKIIRDVKYKYV